MPTRFVTPRDIAWLFAIAALVGLRLLAALNLPVFGAELVHLSGAWQASIGVDDPRFVPTLFQALSALLLEVSPSEAGPRLLAVTVSCSIPAALWLHRSELGHDGALAILALLAIEPLSIASSATASAVALDSAVAVWILLLLSARHARVPALTASGFAAAVCGPAVLFVVLSWFVVAGRGQGARPPILVLAGFGLGIAAASVGFGYGPVTPVVPPFDLIAAGSEQAWSSATTFDLTLLYTLPLLLAGAVAIPPALLRRSPVVRLTLCWSAFSVAWLLFSMPDHNPAALAAATLPLCIVAGFMAPRAARAVVRVPWPQAGVLLAGAAVLLVLAWAILADWARIERTGDATEQARFALFVALATLVLAVLALRPAFRPVLLAPLLLAVAVLLLSGAVGIAAGGSSEPLVSPYTPGQARDLRDLALGRQQVSGGSIVVHPSIQESMTWPFRDSGIVAIATVVPPTAAIVLWPAGEPAPEGFVVVEGSWALTRTIRAPTADLLDSLHWFLDRNMIASKGVSISVYTREQP
ncbi:MAG: hypothetical protein AB7T37_03420 [Dehalococcoidia bacterium]